MLIAISQEKKGMDESAAGSIAEWMKLIGATGMSAALRMRSIARADSPMPLSAAR